MYDKLKTYIILFVAVAIIIKSAMLAGFFKPTSYKGGGIYIKIPKGWELIQEETGEFPSQDSTEPVFRMVMEPPERVGPLTEPAARIEITTKKLSQATWIEDEWDGMLDNVKRSFGRYIDQGEFFIDNQLVKWVFYLDKRASRLRMELYAITDGSLFVKLEYSGHYSQLYGDKFKEYRDDFEWAKGTFKFVFGLF